jgi:hypothetical protein
MNTITIIDWDDSLFPTTWTSRKNINLKCKKQKNMHKTRFSELDNIVHNLLITISNHSKIIIITNASLSWFYNSLNMLPNTEYFIKKYTRVHSARDIHSKTYPNEQNKWKELVYISLIEPVLNIKQNIISIGDGPSEFYALVNLAIRNNKQNIYFKTVRFVEKPSFKVLIDQIRVIDNHAQSIIYEKRHMDLVFKNKKS